jgi:hypothetical protein
MDSGKLASRLIIAFKCVAKLISLYSLSFFFLTKNHGFLYSPLKYSSTPLLSRSLSIFTTSGSSGFKHGKFAACYALCLMVFIIMGGETSLWIRL